MNKMLLFSVTGSVNAGVCLSFGDSCRVWIDFFPDTKTSMFSFMTDEEWKRAEKDPRLFPPDLVLFTHTHPDHFSPPRAREFMSACPEVPFFLPKASVWNPASEISQEQFLTHFGLTSAREISGISETFVLGGLTVRMLRTVHSGARFVSVPHYSFLFSFEGKQIFVSGDALLTDERLTDFLSEEHIDLAVLTFPWAATTVGRERVESAVRPSHVLLYHLPKDGEDPYGFRPSTCSCAPLLNVPDVRLLMDPFHREDYVL